MAHIPPRHDAYLNLDEDMIAKAPIVDKKSNFDLTQDVLNIAYLDHKSDTFKIDDALVYQTLSKIFMDTEAYVYLKQRKSMQYGQAVYFDVHKYFLGPDYVVRQAADVERKL